MEHPILMSTPMVQAILAGRKTQTRRLNGLHEVNQNPDRWYIAHVGQYYTKTKGVKNAKGLDDLVEPSAWVLFKKKNSEQTCIVKCPYGNAFESNLLWVRETFSEKKGRLIYRANVCSKHDLPDGFNWKPSIFMPKAAARVWLQLESIRVERLQQITEQDAIAEGIEPDPTGMEIKIVNGKEVEYINYKNYAPVTRLFKYKYIEPIPSYQSLWDSINKKPATGNQQPATDWQSNPYVWVLTYKVLSTTGKPQPRPEEAIHKPLVNESLKNVPGAGRALPEFDPDEIEDDDGFDCCGECIQPDACRDFGCAVKQGLQQPETII